MATYFTGRKEVGSFTMPLDDGKSSISCKIYEQWQDTDNTTTARCGDPGVIEVKKVVGITERDEQTLKSSIESTVGVKGFAEIKSQMEVSVGREIRLHVEESTSKTSTFTSPKCGRKTMFVYQLVRDYEFSYSRRKWGWTKSWERKIRERSNIHDFMPDIEDYDENCNCKNLPQPESFDGMVVMDMGNISVRAPYRKTTEGIEIRLDASLLKISISSSEDFLVKIPTAALPEMVVFLGDLSGDSVEAAFYEYYNPVAEVDKNFEVVREEVRAIMRSTPSIEILSTLQNQESQN